MAHYVQQKKDDFEYWVTEHLKMNGMYWGIGAVKILRKLHELDRDANIEFVLSCQHENGTTPPHLPTS